MGSSDNPRLVSLQLKGEKTLNYIKFHINTRLFRIFKQQLQDYASFKTHVFSGIVSVWYLNNIDSYLKSNMYFYKNNFCSLAIIRKKTVYRSIDLLQPTAQWWSGPPCCLHWWTWLPNSWSSSGMMNLGIRSACQSSAWYHFFGGLSWTELDLVYLNVDSFWVQLSKTNTRWELTWIPRAMESVYYMYI